MIDITGVDLVKFAQKVYDLSVPQGLGFLHFKSGGLSEEDARELIEKWENMKPTNTALSMDYVHGRACKMHVRKEGGKLLIADTWYDHTDSQFEELLKSFSIELTSKSKHGVACNCNDCNIKRGR